MLARKSPQADKAFSTSGGRPSSAALAFANGAGDTHSPGSTSTRDVIVLHLEREPSDPASAAVTNHGGRTIWLHSNQTDSEEDLMPVHNFAFPVVPGKEDVARTFAVEALGEHRDHYNSLMKASGTTRVTWTLNQTPAGTFVLVWYEADDVQAIFHVLANSAGDDANWMRSRIEETGGIELTGPLPGPPPELILEWPA